MFLETELSEISSLIDQADRENLSVSKKGIDWHVDHMLKVLISIPKVLQSSDPTEYRYQFNLMRTMVYTLNRIPRGKGKAPKHVRTFDSISRAQLKTQLSEAHKALSILENLDKNSHFKHPYFGVLNLKQSKKMMFLHTKHHIKICRDILK